MDWSRVDLPTFAMWVTLATAPVSFITLMVYLVSFWRKFHIIAMWPSFWLFLLCALVALAGFVQYKVIQQFEHLAKPSSAGICLIGEQQARIENTLCDRAHTAGSVAITYSPNAESRGCAYDFLEVFGACSYGDHRWRIFRPRETAQTASGISVQFKSSDPGGTAALAFEQASVAINKQMSDRLLEDVAIEIGDKPR